MYVALCTMQRTYQHIQSAYNSNNKLENAEILSNLLFACVFGCIYFCTVAGYSL